MNAYLLLDKDYVKTKDALIFMIAGSQHFKDAYISILKYKEGAGAWHDQNTSYERILKNYTTEDVKKTYEFLDQNPKYIRFDPNTDTLYQVVPYELIERKYLARERSKEIIENKVHDSLERKAVELVHFLHAKSKVPLSHFGITGSILLNIHNESFSDIDLVVYGRKCSTSLYRAMKKTHSKDIRFLTDHEILTRSKKTKRYKAVSDATILFHEKRKYHRGYFKNTYFSISFAPSTSNYIDRSTTFKKLGKIEIEATISETKLFFTPEIYRIKDFRVVFGTFEGHIDEIVSYERNFISQTKIGERVRVVGLLERVVQNGNIRHRVLLGSQENNGEDQMYIV